MSDDVLTPPAPSAVPVADTANRTPLELRIVAGLLAGAALPLVRDEISIGASEDCDVVLPDEGVPAEPLLLRRQEEGWRDSEGRDWPLGIARSIGPATLAICAVGTPIQAPPPEPPKLSPLAAEAATPVVPEAGSPAPGVEAGAAVASQGKVRRRVVAGLGLCAVLLAVTGLAIVGFGALSGNRAAGPVVGRAGAIPSPPAQQLQLMVGDLLRQRGLDPSVRVLAQTGALRLEGRLDASELSRLDDVLAILRARFGNRVAIQDAVVGVPSDAPLRVRELVIGPATHVILMDGRCVFEGESIDGMRLTRVGEERLAFVAPHEAGS